MKALLSRTAGGPETLRVEDLPSPAPAKGEVVVTVAAVGLNFPDLLIIRDQYQFKPQRPFAPGAEIAGTVTAVGEGVADLAPGTRVLGFPGWGGLAEQVALGRALVTPIPDAMPFADAAAFLMTYGTSYHALTDRAQLKPGETLLVLGASGGVGLAAVELGKALGARVLAACSSQEKLDVALAAGADDGLVYPASLDDKDASRALAERFKTLCGKHGAQVIYDPVGGGYVEPALRAIAWEGRYLVVGFPAGIAKLPMNLPLLKACSVIGVFWGAATQRNPARHVQSVQELFALYQAGKIKPLVETVPGLDAAPGALERLAARQVKGKLVVTLAD
ncbi:MAG: NADPH:quinone oxidoreductase family protein [Rhodobacter sp.]|nr:NADPH:quinone oxidoreductase family protein [Paracoccaceae bacterium]MCC0072686.1 NADPH:quinone oxidoreductase family protein [Rhodobacter sp.]